MNPLAFKDNSKHGDSLKIAAAVLTLFSASAFAQDQMNCRDATVVIYEPGPKWEKFAEHRDAHLSFLEKNMATDVILYAGPFLNEEALDGGLAIYAETEVSKVREVMAHDALVANAVVKPTVKPWMMCEKKNAQPRHPRLGK